jgi:hypothetical protein
MISNKHRALMLLIAMLVLTSCRTKLPDGLSDIGVPMREINSRLHLWIYGAGDSIYKIKNNESMLVGVDVKTKDHIAFARDYGVRLFLKEDNKWIEIKNETTYDISLPEMVIIPAEGYLVKDGAAGVTPYYPSLKKETLLRIVIVGKVVQNGKVTEEKTAAFIDVYLEP